MYTIFSILNKRKQLQEEKLEYGFDLLHLAYIIWPQEKLIYIFIYTRKILLILILN